jgi:hypothetical protein
MQTEAIFENIASKIEEEINKAQKSIYVAVAWFTNEDIFERLLIKAKEGCDVHIIISNDDINNNSSIDFRQLTKYKGKFYRIGNGDTDLMHNKFCVIDNKTVITGSYNWSYKAKNNFENIVINYNDISLAEQYINEFIQIRKKYYPVFQKNKTKQQVKIHPKVVKRATLKEKIKEAIAHPDVKVGTVFIAGVTIEKHFNRVPQMIMELVQKRQLNTGDDKFRGKTIGLHVWMKITPAGFNAIFTGIGITGKEIQEKTAELTREQTLMTFAKVRTILVEGEEEVPTISVKQYSAENGLPNRIQKILDIEESERSADLDADLKRFEMRTNEDEPLVDEFGNQVYQFNELTYGDDDHIFIKKFPLSEYMIRTIN